MWDPETGAESPVPAAAMAGGEFGSMNSPPFDVAVDQDLLLTVEGSKVHVLDRADLRPRAELRAEGRLISVKAVPGSTLAVAAGDDRRLWIWDLDRPGTRWYWQRHSGPVLALAASADGNFVASGSSDGTINIWKMGTNPIEYRTLFGHESGVTALEFLPDGQLVSGSFDGTVRVWNPAAVESLAMFERPATAVTAARFGPAGDLAAVAWEDGRVQVRDARIGDLLGEFVFDEPVVSLVVSGCGQWLAMGFDTGRLQVRDLATGAVRLDSTAHVQAVTDLATLAACGRLISVSADGTLRKWDVAAGVETEDFDFGQPLHAVAVDDARRTIAVGRDDGGVCLLSADDFTDQTLVADATGGGPVTDLAIDPVARLLAVACGNGEVKLWKLADSTFFKSILAHASSVRSLAFNPDGRLATGGEDDTIHVWCVITGLTPVSIRDHDNAIRSLAFAPDGERLVSGSAAGDVRIWDAQPFLERDRKRAVALLDRQAAAARVAALLDQEDGDLERVALLLRSDRQLGPREREECRRRLFAHAMGRARLDVGGTAAQAAGGAPAVEAAASAAAAAGSH